MQEPERKTAAQRKRDQRARVESEGASREDAGAPTEAPSLSAEDAYVAHHLEQTKLYAASFRSKEKRESLAERLERAEAYARWRWASFHSGEVFSL